MAEVLKIHGAGAVLIRHRKKARLTKAKMASRLGWRISRLVKYENNERGLTLSTLEEIAKALGQRAEVLVLLCLKEKYPELKKKGSVIGRQFDALVNALKGGK